MEKITWDEIKRRSNIHKHAIDFEHAAQIFDGRFAIEREDTRRDYGERRMNRLTELDMFVVHATFTVRPGEIRLISVRRANRNERMAYESARNH